MTFKERTAGYWEKVKELSRALKGDGCSSSPDLFYGPCCEEHDVHYRTGMTVDGEVITRKEADSIFLECLQTHGKTPILGTHILPFFYWTAVRIFGKSAWDKDETFFPRENDVGTSE